MVIDGHTHIILDDELPLASFSKLEPMVEYMDRWGIDKVCALVRIDGSALTQENLTKLDPFRNRFLLFAWLNPHDPNAAQVLEHCIDALGFIGLKLHPLEQRFDIDNWELLGPLMDVCSRRHLHTIIHCTSGVPYCNPEKLERLAHRYPDATFQLAHTGAIYDGNPSIAAAARTPNLYLDTGCASFNAIRRAVIACPEKVIMGCDWPSYTFEMELLKCKTACEFAGKPEYYEDLIGGNIARILGLNI